MENEVLTGLVAWLDQIQPVLMISLVMWALAVICFEVLSELRLKRWAMPAGQRNLLLWICPLLFMAFGLFLPFVISLVYAAALCALPGKSLGYWRKLDALILPVLAACGFLALIPSGPNTSGWMLANLPVSVLYFGLWIGMDHYVVRKGGFKTGTVSLIVTGMILPVYLIGVLLQKAVYMDAAWQPTLVSWIFIGLYALCWVVLLGIHRMGIQKNKKTPVKPVLLFDLDGTLIDSQPMVFETFRRVFAREIPEHELTDEELYSFFGPPLEDSFGRFAPSEKVPELIECYQQINKELHATHLQEMPHAREVLKNLHDHGYTIGIVSNKRIEPVKLGLKLSGLEPYIDLVYGKEDLPAAKPSPLGLEKAAQALGFRNDQVVYVGDNAADIRAAKNMAAFSVGYTIDKKQREALLEANACRIIDDLAELEDLLKEDREWNDKSIW